MDIFVRTKPEYNTSGRVCPFGHYTLGKYDLCVVATVDCDFWKTNCPPVDCPLRKGEIVVNLELLDEDS